MAASLGQHALDDQTRSSRTDRSVIAAIPPPPKRTSTIEPLQVHLAPTKERTSPHHASITNAPVSQHLILAQPSSDLASVEQVHRRAKRRVSGLTALRDQEATRQLPPTQHVGIQYTVECFGPGLQSSIIDRKSVV